MMVCVTFTLCWSIPSQCRQQPHGNLVRGCHTVILCFSLFKTGSLSRSILMHIRGKAMAYACTKRFVESQDKVALNIKAGRSSASPCGSVRITSFFFTKTGLGNRAAATLMVIVMLPFFFLAMYEKDGFPAEKILFHIIGAKFLYVRVSVFISVKIRV